MLQMLCSMLGRTFLSGLLSNYLDESAPNETCAVYFGDGFLL